MITFFWRYGSKDLLLHPRWDWELCGPQSCADVPSNNIWKDPGLYQVVELTALWQAAHSVQGLAWLSALVHSGIFYLLSCAEMCVLP